MLNSWDPLADQIRKLKEELWAARMTIIRLAPMKYRDALESYYRCEVREESYAWLERVSEQIIETVEPLSTEKGAYFEPRAYCPLCGDGSLSPYDRGFALPEGLRRHLTGWGRSNHCSVTEAARRLSLDHFQSKFGPAEEAERQAKEKLRAKRIQSEILLRTSPTHEPVLIDEVGYGREPRPHDSLQWAEQRLAELQFQKTEENRVFQYLRETESYGVFADPRARGEIVFHVYRKPFPKRSQRNKFNPSEYFAIKDSWKNDIAGKFDQRLKKALEK